MGDSRVGRAAASVRPGFFGTLPAVRPFLKKRQTMIDNDMPTDIRPEQEGGDKGRRQRGRKSLRWLEKHLRFRPFGIEW